MLDKGEKISNFDEMKKYINEIESLANELLKSTFPEGPSWNTVTCCLFALSNVFVTSNEIILTADFPNIEPETVTVVMKSSNIIEVSAKLKKKVHFDDLGIHHRTGEFSFLRCEGHVNVGIDTEKMKISCKEGFLEVRIPRKKI